MRSVNKWCPMCGAAPGDPCKVVSGEPGDEPGDVRARVHWVRSRDEKPAVLIPDEPGYES